MSVLCHGHLPLLHYLLSTIAVYEPPAPYATTSTLFNLEASTLVLETLPSAAMLYASCEGIFPANISAACAAAVVAAPAAGAAGAGGLGCGEQPDRLKKQRKRALRRRSSPAAPFSFCPNCYKSVAKSGMFFEKSKTFLPEQTKYLCNFMQNVVKPFYCAKPVP